VYDLVPSAACALKLRFSVESRPNPRGLLLLSPFPEAVGEGAVEVLVFPGGARKGTLQVLDMSAQQANVSKAPSYINAHESEIACVAINNKSTLLATASERGTLLRVFDLPSRMQLVELRRGADQALIHSIAFSRDSKWLCCSSDKGTVHIFALQEYHLNRRSRVASLVPSKYHSSQWSVASFTVDSECACVCTFAQESANQNDQQRQSVVVLSYDGKYNRFEFRLNGTCSEPQYDMFMQSEIDYKLAKMRRDLCDL